MFEETNEEANKKKKGTGPAQSPRDSGPAGMDKVGKAGPGGGTPDKTSVTSKSTTRGSKTVGSSGMQKYRDAQKNSPTTTQKKTGTLKGKKP